MWVFGGGSVVVAVCPRLGRALHCASILTSGRGEPRERPRLQTCSEAYQNGAVYNWYACHSRHPSNARPVVTVVWPRSSGFRFCNTFDGTQASRTYPSVVTALLSASHDARHSWSRYLFVAFLFFVFVVSCLSSSHPFCHVPLSRQHSP